VPDANSRVVKVPDISPSTRLCCAFQMWLRETSNSKQAIIQEEDDEMITRISRQNMDGALEVGVFSPNIDVIA
jgi:hypothetical protein